MTQPENRTTEPMHSRGEEEMAALTIPFVVYESAQTRMEWTIKRLIIALIIAVILIFTSNAAWLYCWMQYDYIGEEAETETTYQQDGEGLNNINTGAQGEPSNGAEIDNPNGHPEEEPHEEQRIHPRNPNPKDQKRQRKEAEMIPDLSRSEIEHLIDEFIIGRNAERNRAILRRRLIDGICYEPLAEEFELSVRQVKNIVYKGELQLFKKLQ